MSCCFFSLELGIDDCNYSVSEHSTIQALGQCRNMVPAIDWKIHERTLSLSSACCRKCMPVQSTADTSRSPVNFNRNKLFAQAPPSGSPQVTSALGSRLVRACDLNAVKAKKTLLGPSRHKCRSIFSRGRLPKREWRSKCNCLRVPMPPHHSLLHVQTPPCAETPYPQTLDARIPQSHRNGERQMRSHWKPRGQLCQKSDRGSRKDSQGFGKQQSIWSSSLSL